jgi:hypothetical protein
VSFKLSRAAITKDHIGPSEPHFELHQSIATPPRRRIIVLQLLNNSQALLKTGSIWYDRKNPGYRDVVYDRFRESIKVPSLQFPPKPGHGLLFPYHDHLVPDRDHDHRDLHHGLRGVRRLSVLGLWLVAL